jgi:AraC-like DNA-binding protein
MSAGEGSRPPRADAAAPPQVQVFSTDQVEPHERQAYWKEAIFDAIANVDITCRDEEAFHGRIRWRGVGLDGGGRATFTEVAATPQTARRGARQVGREKEAFFGVTFQRRGASAIEQGGRTDILRPGDVWLLDGTQRSTIELGEPFDQLLLRIPYERLAPRLPRGGQWRGFVLRGTSPLGGVLNAHMDAVAAALQQLDPDSRNALLETTIDLIALAFTDELKKFAGHASTVRRALVLRAMRFIVQHLADPGLSAISVAGTLGVSAGYLQHAFQDAGTTVSGHIRKRRLECCRDDLADPLHGGEQIGEIAMRWGFGDMPHFSRAFKRQFGRSPREHRAQAADRRERTGMGAPGIGF